MNATAPRFTDYLDDRTLPFSTVEVRKQASKSVVLAMAHQTPSLGIKYDPVDDLILSFPIESSSDLVTRDIGLGRQKFRVTPGCILVTPPNVSSYWYFERRYQVLHISFPHKLLGEVLGVDATDRMSQIERLAGRPLNDVLISLMAHRCWAASGEEEKLSDLFLDQALVTLLAALFLGCRPGVGGAEKEAKPSESKLAPWRVARAMDFMLANLSRGVTTRELAENIGLSPYHFLRAFSATTGQTPYQWLSLQRIERAKELLRLTDIPITRIAMDLGFSSAGHFATRFRQLLGFSPGAWRRNFAEDKNVA